MSPTTATGEHANARAFGRRRATEGAESGQNPFWRRPAARRALAQSGNAPWRKIGRLTCLAGLSVAVIAICASADSVESEWVASVSWIAALLFAVSGVAFLAPRSVNWLLWRVCGLTCGALTLWTLVQAAQRLKDGQWPSLTVREGLADLNLQISNVAGDIDLFGLAGLVNEGIDMFSALSVSTALIGAALLAGALALLTTGGGVRGAQARGLTAGRR